MLVSGGGTPGHAYFPGAVGHRDLSRHKRPGTIAISLKSKIRASKLNLRRQISSRSFSALPRRFCAAVASAGNVALTQMVDTSFTNFLSNGPATDVNPAPQITKSLGRAYLQKMRPPPYRRAICTAANRTWYSSSTYGRWRFGAP